MKRPSTTRTVIAVLGAIATIRIIATLRAFVIEYGTLSEDMERRRAEDDEWFAAPQSPIDPTSILGQASYHRAMIA